MGSGNTKLEAALRLAELGFYVFRLQRNGKKPFATGWQNEATRDPDEIRTLFENHDFNIGIFTEFYLDTESLVVVDVDTKPGKKGADTFAEHEAYGNDFPPTWEVTTASGGRHLFYRTPLAYSGGANKLGLHIDVKSYGGYVVGAGSTIDGKPYYWVESFPTLGCPAECPDWILARLNKPLPKNQQPNAVETLDTLDIIERGRSYLATDATPAVANAGGNETTLKTALKLKDYGVSEASASTMMWEIYNPRCTPPWDWDELLPIIANAYRYGSQPAGIAAPAADFDPISPDEIPTPDGATKKEGLYAKHISDIRIQTGRKALIKGLLDPNAMSVLYGESNTGKTFVAMDIAYHIAAGIAYDGRPTEQGSIFYVAAEAGRSAETRVAALRKRFDGAVDTPFFLIPCQIDLYNSNADAKELVDLIEATLSLHPEAPPPAFIVIDTLARAMAGGNENAFEDMSAFVKKIAIIQRLTQAHVMIVHHSGKDTAKGARGHSSLRAATDTELEVADGVITARKQRDMEMTKPIGFQLETVELGFDAYNEKITSCVIKKVEAPPAKVGNKVRGIKMEPRDQAAYLALKEIETGRSLGGYENVVDSKEWAKSCKDYNIALIPDMKPWPISNEAFNVAFKRSRDKLAAMELVAEIQSGQWVILNNNG